jgi:hypothetical protein
MNEIEIIILGLILILVIFLIQQNIRLKKNYEKIYSIILYGLKEDVTENELVKIATNIWRFKVNLEVQFKEGKIPKELERPLQSMIDWLKTKGVSFADYTNYPSNGLNVQVLSSTPERSNREPYIIKTLRPEIRINGKIILKSQVDTRYPAIKKKYQITFDLNGGNNQIVKPLEFEEDHKISGFESVTYDGHVFKGWKDKKTQKIISFPFSLNDHLECIAVWDPIHVEYIAEREKIKIKYFKNKDEKESFEERVYIVGGLIEEPTTINLEFIGNRKLIGWKRIIDDQLVTFPFEAKAQDSLYCFFEEETKLDQGNFQQKNIDLPIKEEVKDETK